MGQADSVDEALNAALSTAAYPRYLLAFSGGVDSQALLHALARWASPRHLDVLAVHIDHGLHPDSGGWAQRCRDFAEQLGVAFHCDRLDAPPTAGDSIEAWARRRRYEVLGDLMKSGDALLTAHHRDDQTETFFLQLLRGAGPHGLAAIAPRHSFGPGTMLRPLLPLAGEAIRAYAALHELEWIDDPSNENTRYDRNYLRHEILPRLKQRWPAVSARVAHAATLQQEAAATLDEIADKLLSTSVQDNDALDVSELQLASSALQRWILRRWISRESLPLPDAAHLREMQKLLSADAPARGRVCWKGAQLRRYRDKCYLDWIEPRVRDRGEYDWDPNFPLDLAQGRLQAQLIRAPSLDLLARRVGTFRVRFRRGGERCHPAGRAHSQTLKRLFQEWGVPPWLRESTPLIYCGDELAAIPDHCVCRQFVASDGEEGWQVQWRRHAFGDSGSL